MITKSKEVLENRYFSAIRAKNKITQIKNKNEIEVDTHKGPVRDYASC